MTKKELEALDVGTMVYNGHTEGVIAKDGDLKVIEIWIPIHGMSNDAKDFNERPLNWSVLDT